MRFQLLQQDVARDFEGNVGHEEYGQGRVILRRLEAQLLLKPEHGSISDVGSVEKGQQVEDAQHRDD